MSSFTADGVRRFEQSAAATQTVNTVVLREVVTAGCHPDTGSHVTRIAIIRRARFFFPKLGKGSNTVP